MKSVLVIEDDKEIVELLKIHLKDLDCKVDKAFNGLDGLKKATDEQFDLIILDVMLPYMDGIEVCRQLRAQQDYTPILMLTAKSEEIDKVLGLETGADDYLTKPFSIREFVSRVKAILRRVHMIRENLAPEPGKVIQVDQLAIDGDKRKVTLKDNTLNLTPKEFDLLWLMASHPGRSYSREQLLNMIWGLEFRGYEHTVNSHINRLRTKIEADVNQPRYILTTWGIGYRFNDEI
ncbi:MAG: response regulator transcription factor [Candidatus Cyclobacteriaceae bacterium M3_2C_046]